MNIKVSNSENEEKDSNYPHKRNTSNFKKYANSKELNPSLVKKSFTIIKDNTSNEESPIIKRNSHNPKKSKYLGTIGNNNTNENNKSMLLNPNKLRKSSFRVNSSNDLSKKNSINSALNVNKQKTRMSLLGYISDSGGPIPDASTMNISKEELMQDFDDFKVKLKTYYDSKLDIIQNDHDKLKSRIIQNIMAIKDNLIYRIDQEKQMNLRNIEDNIKNNNPFNYMVLNNLTEFFNTYDDNAYKLILYTYNNINIKEYDKMVKDVKNKINNKLFEYPKKFPSEILRYFTDKINENYTIFEESGEYRAFNVSENAKRTNNIKISLEINTELNNNLVNKLKQNPSIHNHDNIISNKMLDDKNRSVLRDDKLKLTIKKVSDHELYTNITYKAINKSPVIQVYNNDIFLYSYNNILKVFKINNNNINSSALKFEYINAIKQDDIHPNLNIKNENNFYNDNKILYDNINCMELWYRHKQRDLCLILGTKKGVILYYYN